MTKPVHDDDDTYYDDRESTIEALIAKGVKVSYYLDAEDKLSANIKSTR